MKITVERIKEIIREEHDKFLEGDDGPLIHAKGLGTYGDDPKWVIDSALQDLELFHSNIGEARQIVQSMASNDHKIDAEELELAISNLSSRLLENAKAKLEGALEQRMEIHEAKNEKKRT